MSRFPSEVSRLAGQTDRDSRRGPTRDKPPSGVCPVGCVPGQMSRLSVPVVAKPVPSGSLRQAMPLTAGVVDELRQAFGDELVNRCIARGQSLRRDHARILATQGQAEAARWLAREQAKGGWFGAAEGGRVVGVMTVGGAP